MNKTLSINENYSLALKNYNMRNFVEAEIFCKKILSINSNHFESIWLMGLMSIREKKFKIANSFFLQAANIKPKNEKIYNNKTTIKKSQISRKYLLQSLHIPMRGERLRE